MESRSSVSIGRTGGDAPPHAAEADAPLHRKVFRTSAGMVRLTFTVPADERGDLYAELSLAASIPGGAEDFVRGAIRAILRHGGIADRVDHGPWATADARQVPLAGAVAGPSEMRGAGWRIAAPAPVPVWVAQPAHLLSVPPPGVADGLVGLPPVPDMGSVPSGRAPCVDCGEPLVNIGRVGGRVAVLDAYGRLGILPGRTLRCRAGLAERLSRASAGLPERFGLVILDGTRTEGEQRALLEHYSLDGPTEGYVAALGDDEPRPPHLTGGAVDLTLCYDGVPLALGTDFDTFSQAAWVRSFEGSDTAVERLRRLLASALVPEGLVPYPYEWWHWSYGEDWWAASSGTKPIYDIVAPGMAGLGPEADKATPGAPLSRPRE